MRVKPDITLNLVTRHLCFILMLMFMSEKVDCQPTLTCNPPSPATVQENTPPGYVVTTCTVQPPDAEMVITSGADSFEVVPVDGTDTYQLVTTITPDFETTGSYSVALVAQSGAEKSIETIYLVIIMDVDEYDPIFDVSTVSTTIKEGITQDAIVTLSNTDGDGSDDYNYKSIHYAVQDDYGGTFSLRPPEFDDAAKTSTLIIDLVKALDYETLISYTLKIQSIDGGGLTADATVIVNVQDVDDTPPFFNKIQSYMEISEDVPIGTSVLTVTAQDGDRGINNPVTYSITDGNTGDAFRIDDSGTVYVDKALDRDAGMSLYTLNITATEANTPAGQDPQRASTVSTISLEDVDDSTPTFQETLYQATVPENSPKGFVVSFEGSTQIIVTDADLNENAAFTIALNDPEDIFQIAPPNGNTMTVFTLSVLNPANLDYEKITGFSMEAVVTDTGNPVLVNTATISIIVQNENDQAPQFTDISCDDITENAKAGTQVCTVKAVDPDTGGSDHIVFSATYGQLLDSLQIDPATGTITVAKDGTFDYEVAHEYYITIMAQDDDGKGLTNSSYTEIHILDANDNPPVIRVPSSTVSLNENEDFYVPLVIQATDLDSGVNGEVEFSLIDNEYFQISNDGLEDDMYKGTVTPIVPLDFESFSACMGDSNCPIPLTIQASDKGSPPQTSTASITIMLMDLNDETPSFEQSSYSATIDETVAPGTSVATVKATDGDSSPKYNTIAYRIQNDEIANFVIDSVLGVISVAPTAKLDPDLYGGKYVYNLTITADDGGFHEDDTDNQCTVLVNIHDIDNKAPAFDGSGIYQVSIVENSTSDDPFYDVAATDPDLDADLQYTIDFANSLAVDNYGTPVTQPLDDYFRQDVDSGSLYTKQPVDREVMQRVVLSLVVIDNNTAPEFASFNSATGSITIDITDIDDNPPVFDRNDYTGSVSESSPNAVVSMEQAIKTSDLDYDYGIRTYSVVSQDPDSGITIDPQTATLFTSGEGLDYETSPEVIVVIRVEDNGDPPLSSTATVTVSVINVNEYDPGFSPTSYTFTIDENSLEFDQQAQVYATDADAGTYGEIAYKLDEATSEGYSYFYMNTSGALYVARSNGLDYEEKASYTLTVIAYDNPGGLPSTQKTGYATIVVSVTELNDNSPKLNNLPNTDDIKHVSEGAKPGYKVFTIDATDGDIAGNPDSTLVYQLDNYLDLFQISDSSKPDVTVKGSLLNQGFLYNLNITVTDQGKNPGPLSSMAQLYIDIDDVNNNPPVIYDPPEGYEYSLQEYPATADDDEIPLFTVRYTDSDNVPENKVSTYSISGVCDEGGEETQLFGIDTTPDERSGEATGDVYMLGKLDRQECIKYKLQVTATNDNPDPDMGPQSGTITYYIRVLDVDNYPPGFDDPRESNVSFVESQDAGSTSVTLPPPYDQDVQQGDPLIPIFCFIAGGADGTEPFTITNDPDGINCQLSTTAVLDRETKKSYELYVVATETLVQPPPINVYDPFNKSQMLVQVAVGDINDSPPHFTDSAYYTGVSEDTPNTEAVYILTADDPDDIADLGQLTYGLKDIFIVNEANMENIPANETFSIETRQDGDTTVGAIILNYGFVDSMQGYIGFTAVVYDSGTLHNGTASVTIYVVSSDQKLYCTSTNPPEQFQFNMAADFAEEFTNVLDKGYQVVVDAIKSHQEKDGTPIASQTDIFIHLVNDKNKVMSAPDAMDVINKKSTELYSTVFEDYDIYYVGPVVPYVASKKFDLSFYILIAVAGLLAVTCVVLLSVCIYKTNKMGRQLQAIQATSFASQKSGLNRIDIPGTNVHDGANPVWREDFTNEIAADYEDTSDMSSSLEINEHDFQGGKHNPTMSERIDRIFDDANYDAGSYGDNESIDKRYSSDFGSNDSADNMFSSNVVMHSDTSDLL